jgi:hypothetical protein
MNEINNLVINTEQKIDKIRTLTILLMDMERATKTELLDKETRDQLQPIIKKVMEKINEISKS